MFGSTYKTKKIREAKRSRDNSRAGRDIGPIPPVANPKRREAAAASLAAYCHHYLPEVFSLPWSADHKKVIARLEEAATHGGQFAVAMPRGSGKTSLSLTAALWATMTGRRRYVVLIGAEDSKAAKSLRIIKETLRTGDTPLTADWPEICHPILALDRITQRAAAQLCEGKPTGLVFSRHEIVFPSTAGPAAGATLCVAGLTASLRGMQTAAQGRIIRPDLVIIDDPQTDESARSPHQCAERERIITGAVLGLAGPGQKIAAICPCTVIRAGDLADTLLDRDKHPEWTSQRHKMVYAWPDRTDLWDQYAEIRRASLRADGDGREATEFYRQHRAEMDAGAIVAWPERHDADELSALQNAQNLRIKDEGVFFAEYQNEPARAATTAVEVDRAATAKKTNGLRRGLVPTDAPTLTAYIDVQHSVLFWSAVAWRDDFTGYVVDYGTWPKQTRTQFTLRGLRHTLAKVYPGAGLQGQITAGLADLVDHLAKPWPTESNTETLVARILIDAADGQLTETIAAFVRRHPQAARLMPATGRGIGPSDKPMDQWPRKPGERHGHKWVIVPSATHRTRFAVLDANFWKSTAAAGLAAAIGDRGAITFFGDRSADHSLFADHCAAEYAEPIKNEKTGRTVTVWRQRPAKPDNHWFDCLAGCAAAAAMSGAQILPPAKPKTTAAGPTKKPKPRRNAVSYLS